MRHVPTVSRRAAAAALLALALAGCRDLALPSPPSSPTVTDFAPHFAYAGQLIDVSGTGFDSAASANTVNFAFASARAEKWSGGSLVVRVPADAGSGPITVTGTQGTSKPSTRSFAYRGLGQPRRGQVAGARPILHRPGAVFAASGDVILHSALYDGLVWAGNSAFSTPSLLFPAAAPWQGTGGALYYVTVSATGSAITRVDASTGVASAPLALPATFRVEQLVPLRGGINALAVFGADAGVEKLAVFDLGTMVQRLAPTAYGVDFFFGAADVGDGRVVVGTLEPSFPFSGTLAVVNVATLLTGPSTPVVLAPPLGTPAITSLSGGNAYALAVARDPGLATPHFAAVGLDNGDVAVADLDVATPAFVRTINTWSPSGIEAIAASPANGTLGSASTRAIATKPADGLAIGFDLATGNLLWSVPANSPTAAGADGPLAFVADAGDNDVAVVNLTTGARIARVNLDVLPRAAGYTSAAAFVPATNGIDGDVLFPSFAFPALLRWDTALAEPRLVTRGPKVDFVDADMGTRSAWATVSGSATPSVPARVLAWSGGVMSAPTSVTLTGATTVQRTAARGTMLVVAHDAGLSLLDGATFIGSVAIPGAAMPIFRALGFTSSGEIWTVVDRGTDFQAQLWPPATFSAAGSPRATWTVPGTPSTAALLEDGLWVFRVDATVGPIATLLDGSLAPVRTVATSPELVDVQAVSPNGRLLVQREFDTSLGYVLRFLRADPGTGFPSDHALVFPERVEAFTFDSTGERLYVLTQAPDRIITVD